MMLQDGISDQANEKNVNTSENTKRYFLKRD